MDNAGIRIKSVAIIFLIIGIILSVVGGIVGAVATAQISDGVAAGVFIGVAFVGSFGSYIPYVLMSGFGELVDRTISIDNKLKDQNVPNTKPRNIVSKPTPASQPKPEASMSKVSEIAPAPKPASSTPADCCIVCKRMGVTLKTVKVKHNGIVQEAKICSDCYAKKMAEKK